MKKFLVPVLVAFLPVLAAAQAPPILRQAYTTNDLSTVDARVTVLANTAAASKQTGSAVLTNLSNTGALTNGSAFQPASATLSNAVGTGVLTNASQFIGSSSGQGTNTTFHGTLTGDGAQWSAAVYSSASSASNAPAENEFPVAKWVRSLFNSGQIWYNSDNVFTAATNTSSGQVEYAYTNIIPPTTSRTYVAPNLNDYIGSVIVPTNYLNLQGPVAVNAYIQRLNGIGGPAISIHPEIYYSYDRTNWFGDWEAADQVISTGTNLYQWVITFPTIVSTNTTGFWIQRRMKVGSVSGAVHPDVVFHIGTNYLTGTNDAARLAFSGPASAAQITTVYSISTNNPASSLTNLVVDFGQTYSVIFATNDLRFMQTTNRGAGVWRSAVTKIYAGPTNRQIWLNPSWTMLGTTTNYTLLVTNKVAILSLAQDGLNETNVAAVLVVSP